MSNLKNNFEEKNGDGLSFTNPSKQNLFQGATFCNTEILNNCFNR